MRALESRRSVASAVRIAVVAVSAALMVASSGRSRAGGAVTPATLAAAPLGDACGGKRLLAYYPYYWPDYRADRIPYSKLTHISHAFVQPQASGALSAPAGYLEPALLVNAHSAGIKVLVSIGGEDSTADQNFRLIAASPSLRSAFAANIESFCRINGYDGVDIDWEFPRSASDRVNQNAMIQVIRSKFDSSPAPAPAWLVSMAVAATDWDGQWNDYATLNGTVSFYNLMTYEFHGAWSSHSGHNSALVQGGDVETELNWEGAFDYMLGRGVPRAKINMGVPFYGKNFANSETLYDDCGGDCAENTYDYHQIAPLIGSGWSSNWDAGSKVPYLTKDSGTGVLSFENAQSVSAKVGYALSTRTAGGVFMWEITGDDMGGAGQPLMDAMVGTYLSACSVERGLADYSGDGRDELGVFRNGMWFLSDSPDYVGVDHAVAFGSTVAGRDTPQIGEFGCVPEGGGLPDGKTDLAVLRSAYSTWQTSLSPAWSGTPALSVTFGTTNHKRISARRLDTNGDGCSDIGVFRGSCFDVLHSPGYSTVGTHVCFGLGTDTPLAGDLDSDGKSDLILWRPTSAHYSYRISSEAYGSDHGADVGAGDYPLVGDLNGDGKVDLGSYNQASSTFRFTYSPDFTGVDSVMTHGVNGDVPIIAEVNGDGISDIGIFRNSSARWWFFCSPGWSSTCVSTSFGTAGDIPIYGKPPGMP